MLSLFLLVKFSLTQKWCYAAHNDVARKCSAVMWCLPTVPKAQHHSRSEHHCRRQHHLPWGQTSFSVILLTEYHAKDYAWGFIVGSLYGNFTKVGKIRQTPSFISLLSSLFLHSPSHLFTQVVQKCVSKCVNLRKSKLFLCLYTFLQFQQTFLAYVLSLHQHKYSLSLKCRRALKHLELSCSKLPFHRVLLQKNVAKYDS